MCARQNPIHRGGLKLGYTYFVNSVMSKDSCARVSASQRCEVIGRVIGSRQQQSGATRIRIFDCERMHRQIRKLGA